MQSTHAALPSDPAVIGEPATGGDASEAWIANTAAEAMVGDVASADCDAEAVEPTGPVNAAEALALALAQGTFSSARKLSGPDGAELVVDPAQDAYYFESTSLKPLDALLAQPASAWTPVYSEAVKAARAAHPAQSLERLRWYAGLVATPGILNRKLSRNVRYRLSRWPETEREFPRHFRIAKEMLKGLASVDDVVAASGMPHDQVVDYVNASFASGRLEPDPATVASEEVPAPRSRRERFIAVLNKPLFTH